jgi:hypothetical protein
MTQKERKFSLQFNNIIGSKYESYKKNEVREGKGKIRLKEGSLYEVYWKNDKIDGYGILYCSNENITYEGDWN